MKKLIASIFLVSSPLFAFCDCEPQYYLGKDISYSQIDYYNTDASATDSQPGPIKHTGHVSNIYIGQRLGDNLSIEGGFFAHIILKQSGEEGQTKAYGGHFGLMFPFLISDKIELLPGIGMAHTFTHAYKANVFEYREHAFVPRGIIAVQYKYSKNLKFRCSVAIHSVANAHGMVATSNNLNHFGCGMQYTFDAK